MHQSRLFYLLKGLTSTEFKRFSKFIQSPFYCTNPTQLKFYQILKRYFPKFSSPRLEKEKVYEKLYPNQRYNYHHFGNLMTEMTRLVEEFMIQLEMENEDFLKRKTLIKALGSRNLYTAFEKRSMNLMGKLEKSPSRDIDYFRRQMDLQYTYFFHPKTKRYDLEKDFPKMIMDNLDRYFALSKLNLAIALKNREKMLSVQYDIQMLDSVRQFSNSQEASAFPIIQIYNNILALHEEGNKAEFLNLKTIFEKEINHISKEEQKDILVHLLNYSIRQINGGFFSFNQDALDLFKLGLKQDLIIENKEMRAGTYMNIADTAGVLKDFEWAESCFENNAVFLNEDIRNFIKALSLGELRFRQNRYDEVVEILILEQFTIVLFEIKARFLLIKTWYEKYLKDESVFEFLMAQIEAFEKFLQRKDVLGEMKSEGNLNFLKIIRQLVKGKNRLLYTQEFYDRLVEKAKLLNPLYGRVWLNEKIQNFQP